MTEALKHLVLIDPTQDHHIALERAVVISRMREPKPHVRLFIGVDGENTDLRASNPHLYRDGDWLESLTRPLRDEDLTHSFELCWSDDWQAAVLNCAESFQPSRVFMPDYDHGKKLPFFSAHQWALLRKSKAPVTIVRPGESGSRKRLLAAVNIQKEDNPRYASLNEKILTSGMELARQYGAEFYVVNAYHDSLHYPDREKLMKRTGLPTGHVHVEEGPAVDVIADYANKIHADAVVIGTLARTGALALMKGNTSEKVLRRVNQDVITYC